MFDDKRRAELRKALEGGQPIAFRSGNIRPPDRNGVHGGEVGVGAGPDVGCGSALSAVFPETKTLSLALGVASVVGGYEIEYVGRDDTVMGGAVSLSIKSWSTRRLVRIPMELVYELDIPEDGTQITITPHEAGAAVLVAGVSVESV
jgi:hypothetical protein